MIRNCIISAATAALLLGFAGAALAADTTMNKDQGGNMGSSNDMKTGGSMGSSGSMSSGSGSMQAKPQGTMGSSNDMKTGGSMGSSSSTTSGDKTDSSGTMDKD